MTDDNPQPNKAVYHLEVKKKKQRPIDKPEYKSVKIIGVRENGKLTADSLKEIVSVATGIDAHEPDKNIAILARQYTRPALGVLLDIMGNGKHDGARIEAARVVLAYGHGLPTQRVEHENAQQLVINIAAPVSHVAQSAPVVAAGETIDNSNIIIPPPPFTEP